jgi:bis(5'-nucleosidyl)-tetraphosphatase
MTDIMKIRNLEIQREHPEDEISAGFIIFDKSTREVLLSQGRKYEWKFSKGHIEQNESILECAFRETFEEVGIKLNITNVHQDFHYCYSSKRINKNKNRVSKFVYLFLAVVDKNEHPLKLQEEEIVDATWININQAKKMIEISEIRDGLDKAYHHFHLHSNNHHFVNHQINAHFLHQLHPIN